MRAKFYCDDTLVAEKREVVLPKAGEHVIFDADGPEYIVKGILHNFASGKAHVFMRESLQGEQYGGE